MPSYQDIETRLRVIEDKVEFILKTFTVTKQYESLLVPGQVIRESKTLLDVYRELKSQSAIIMPINDEQANGSTDQATE